MANEIAVINKDVSAFHSHELKVKTGQIFNALRDNNRNSLKIAGLLSVIHEQNLFIDDFDSFETYAQQVFGLKKAQAYNLVRVGREWVAADDKGRVLGESILPHAKSLDWTTTKLLALTQADVNYADAMRLIESDIIGPEMSVSALKAALKEFKALRAGNPDADADTEETADDGPETESNADEKPEETADDAQRHFMELITTATKNAAGIMDDAAKRGIITDESRAAWVAAMASITQGFNALAALISDT